MLPTDPEHDKLGWSMEAWEGRDTRPQHMRLATKTHYDCRLGAWPGWVNPQSQPPSQTWSMHSDRLDEEGRGGLKSAPKRKRLDG